MQAQARPPVLMKLRVAASDAHAYSERDYEDADTMSHHSGGDSSYTLETAYGAMLVLNHSWSDTHYSSISEEPDFGDASDEDSFNPSIEEDDHDSKHSSNFTAQIEISNPIQFFDCGCACCAGPPEEDTMMEGCRYPISAAGNWIERILDAIPSAAFARNGEQLYFWVELPFSVAQALKSYEAQLEDQRWHEAMGQVHLIFSHAARRLGIPYPRENLFIGRKQ